MVKPRKKRNVLYPPWMHYFKPHGHMPFEPGLEVILTIDEYESIRLADHENLKQEEAAKRMNIKARSVCPEHALKIAIMPKSAFPSVTRSGTRRVLNIIVFSS